MIRIYFFGKKSDLIAREEEYLRRIGFSFSVEVLPLKASKSGDRLVAKKQESEILLSKLSEKDFLIALDENGKKLSSPQFSELLSQKIQDRIRICFVIGGAGGLGELVLNRADFSCSLGAMVWTKDLARLMLLEQIYRGLEIQKGTSFHKA